MSVTLELDEAVVFVALKKNLSFNEYKLLADWLDCYNYVLPANRELSIVFVNTIIGFYPKSPTEIYKTWMKANLVNTTLTLVKQLKIISWTCNHQM